MGRGPCCDKAGLKKGPWTAEEDHKLTSYIRQHGHESWRALPKKAGLMRCGKSCRLRWTNYLRPDIKRGELTALEEQTILQLHALLGNRWSAIAAHLPKRTDNEIKNHWNTHLKKRLVNMGLDPATHKPATDTLPWSVGSRLSESPNSSSSLAHTAQWESARLEAEARLAKESELRASGLWPVPASPQRSGPSTYCDQLSSNQCLIDIMALKQDMGRLVSLSSREGHSNANSHNNQLERNRVPTKAFTSLDLPKSFHNWEYSLQGQLGLMGPDAWKLLSAATKGQQDSSSCSSVEETISHSSPSSTFSFFDSPDTPTPVQGPSAKALMLSWSDALQQAETRMEKPTQSSSSDTVGSMTFGKSDRRQAATSNICADESLSTNLASPVHNSARVAEFCDAVARDGDTNNQRELMGLSTSKPLDGVDQHPSLEETTDVTRNCLLRLLSAHEDDLDYYWDDLLAASPKQVEEEKPFGNLFL